MKVVGVAVLSVLVSSVIFDVRTADAADMPLKAAPIAVSVYSWTGWYVGVNAGYGWSSDPAQANCTDSAGVASGPFCQSIPLGTQRGYGALGGGQFGYNYQVNNIVVGFESDLQASRIQNTTALNGPFPFLGTGLGLGIPTATWQSGETLDWFGTVRPRIGLVLFDRALIYATGGLAYGGLSINSNFSTPDVGAPTMRPASRSLTQVGWVSGGGVEMAVSKNVSFKAEGLYMDLGNAGTSGAEVPLTYLPMGFTYGKSFSFREVIARAGLNFKLGNP